MSINSLSQVPISLGPLFLLTFPFPYILSAFFPLPFFLGIKNHVNDAVLTPDYFPNM